MTNLFKILSLLNFDMMQEIASYTNEFKHQCNDSYLISRSKSSIDIQHTYTNLNTEITDKFIISKYNDFSNLNGFNDNIQLPLVYVDEYSLQTMGNALPDF